jgi:hypothetical protein
MAGVGGKPEAMMLRVKVDLEETGSDGCEDVLVQDRAEAELF